MITIDGKDFHSQHLLDDDGEIISEELILDEDGKPISSTMCICHAFEPNECCCGAWDDVDLEDWYTGEE